VEQKSKGISRNEVRGRLEIPCKYYMDRGYSSEVLDKYDVGLCSTKGKRMYKRAVVPVYNNEYTHAVGFTGRATFEDHKYKWVHNTGFLANDHLYNYWFAKEHIVESGCVVLVEGPGDVWRLEENGIHISVAMFGTDLSDQQMSLLYGSGANSVVVLTDNDEAGRKSALKINDKCKRLFRMFFPKLSTSDVGELGSDEITSDIKPILDQAGIYF
jgi:DNA primase